MELSNLTENELLSRRHQAFLLLGTARGSDPRREVAYDEIKRINQELVNRRPPRAGEREAP